MPRDLLYLALSTLVHLLFNKADIFTLHYTHTNIPPYNAAICMSVRPEKNNGKLKFSYSIMFYTIHYIGYVSDAYEYCYS